MNEQFVRVTFISADGNREERAKSCKPVNVSEDHGKVYVPAVDAPCWVSSGDEVVVAENGNVESAFTIKWIRYRSDGAPDRGTVPWSGATKMFASYRVHA